MAANFFVSEGRLLSKEFIDLLKDTLFLIPNWKWIVFAVALLVGLTTRPLIQFFVRSLKTRTKLAQEKSVFWRSLITLNIEKPLSWLLLALTWRFIIDTVEFTATMDKHMDNIAKLIISYQTIKLLYLIIDAFGAQLEAWAALTENPIDDQLAPFATKTLKVTVIVLGGLIILQNFGVNVMSLLAGLGLGGLALALAAQDTAANLFGSITILMDHPFKIGDWIKIGDSEGTVEEIGFRSTRIRTFYNSILTIPNSVVAKEKIDNMGIRPMRRIRTNLGLHYDTKPEQIVQFCERVKEAICKRSQVDTSSVVVAFNGYADSSLNVLVNFHIRVTSNAEELQVQQDLFCEFLSIATEMNVSYAYPSRTIYLESAVQLFKT